MLGFIGLGTMGRGMAQNLLKSGLPLTVCDVREEALSPFRALGVAAVSDPRGTAACDVLFFCLPDETVVEELLFGARGLFPLLRPGRIIVDCSTQSALAAAGFASQLEAAGVSYLDAPVSGMEQKALDGTLTIMCGGREETFRAVKPLLGCMGTNVVYMGGSGSGQLAKAVNNCLYDINCAALCEMLAAAAKLGLDPERIGQVICGGTGRSYASEYFVPRILRRDFAYGFTMEQAYKDIQNLNEACDAAGFLTPVLDAAAAVYRETLEMGFGHLYKGAMILPYEARSGLEFKPAENKNEV